MEKQWVDTLFMKYLWNYAGSSHPTLKNSLIGAVELINNDDIDKYKYSGFGIGFDMKETFS